jgi:hypothetical protein
MTPELIASYVWEIGYAAVGVYALYRLVKVIL